MEARAEATEAVAQATSGIWRRSAGLSEQVEALTKTLAQSEAVSQLAAGIAHDLLNSLQVVLGEAEELVLTLKDTQQAESARAVVTAGRHAALLARDLLGLARREKPGAPQVDTRALLERCERLIQPLVGKSIECVFAVDAELWPVMLPPQQLEAALINLSANARDAMPQGGKLRVQAENLVQGARLPAQLQSGEWVVFSVSDTGVGMTPEVRARATEAFFTTKTAERGSGLGLAMVQALVNAAGGALEIESAAQRGTCIRLVLPRAPRPTELHDADTLLLTPELRAMALRVREPKLRPLLNAWAVACAGARFPHPMQMEQVLGTCAEYSMILAVEPSQPSSFRLVQLGQELVHALQRSAWSGLAREDGDILSSLPDAYRKALKSNQPTYERLSFSFGDDPPVEMERLILPTALDGERISHLIGIVVFAHLAPET